MRTQIPKILRQKEAIVLDYAINPSSRKRCRLPIHADINDAMYVPIFYLSGKQDLVFGRFSLKGIDALVYIFNLEYCPQVKFVALFSRICV